MRFSGNAEKVLQRRYLSRDVDGILTEDIPGLFHRVARHIASADLAFDKKADVAATEAEFYHLMTSKWFMPNSPTLMNAGKPLGQLSACFVLPVGDSMEEIFDALKSAALIHKSGGGTGFSFSRLRPSGASVRSTGGVASGPVSFMRVFNSATEAVKQGGTRRGANMGILRVDHPDILNFIDCKRKNSDITNFNISVGLTEAFVKAALAGETYELLDPRTRQTAGTLCAKEVFEKIVDAAWKNGEPGIVFIDRLNQCNVVPHLGEIEATNPCGEQPLLPYESCNLGSINLAEMLCGEEGQYRVDYDLLGATIDSAVHFLDNVIEVNQYPLDEIEQMTKKTRKIGLGVMGWADMLFKLRVPYNSPEGVALADDVMGFVQKRSHEASCALAQKRGVFPAFEGSVYEARGERVRNATATTIAPTGTISIICGVSSGVEPLFAISFVRNVMDNDELPEVNPYFEEVAKREGFYSAELMRRIAREGTLAHIDEIPAHIKRVFVTAHDISPVDHINMQAAFQRHTDNAVSKTVNFANSATREDVRDAYLLAFESGCKGVTIYRDGSREEQVLNIGAVKRKDAAGDKAQQISVDLSGVAASVTPRARPAITTGMTEKVQIGCGNLYITVNYDENGICEVFTNLGRAGGCPSQSEATSRLISVALRSGMDVEAIVEQLKGIRCHSTLRQMNQKGIKVLSCPDAIARVISKVAKSQQFLDKKMSVRPLDIEPDVQTELAKIDQCGPLDPQERQEILSDLQGCSTCSLTPGLSDDAGHGQGCPECGAGMDHEGGCVICRNCGYSKCG